MELRLDDTAALGDVKELRGLASLEHLSLRFCNLHGDPAAFANLRDLETLCLSHVPAVRGGVAAFAQLPHLRRVNLFYCRGLSGSADAFLQCADLVYLNVQQTGLDDVLRFFHARPRVETLFDRARNPTRRPGAPRPDDDGDADGDGSLPAAPAKLAPLSPRAAKTRGRGPRPKRGARLR